jgi:RNA polymerase subunit RPABC4/transcription elongation factor Spt4
MAFFEDLGKKVSQTSQDAIKKTKIMAETSRLNSQISAEKRLISDNFSKMGEKYFELFSDSPDENLAGFVGAIQEAQQRIMELEEQIKKLRGIDSCPNCGTELREGALFCTVCGTKLSAPPPPEPAAQVAQKACGSCGAVLPNDSLFCSGCGAKVE